MAGSTTQELPTWQLQRTAAKLETDIRQLKVAMAELDTVKPKKATYVKRANVFFLDRRDAIVKTKRSELESKEQQRYDIGLQLRSAGASVST